MLHQTSSRGPWSATASGRAFYPGDPRPEDVRVEDMARSLSNIDRFNGMFKRANIRYSVAEHAVRCYWLAAEMYPTSPRTWYWSLHHDSEEAYTGDIITQIKALVPELRRVIEPIKSAVVTALDLWPREEPPEVKDIDLILFATERRDLMADTSNWTPEIWGNMREPLPTIIQGNWSSEDAEAAFLNAHYYCRNIIDDQERARAG